MRRPPADLGPSYVSVRTVAAGTPPEPSPNSDPRQPDAVTSRPARCCIRTRAATLR